MTDGRRFMIADWHHRVELTETNKRWWSQRVLPKKKVPEEWQHEVDLG